MFGTDEHSKALLGQWSRAKQLRDPDVVIQLAKSKGMHMFKAHTLDATMYIIDRGGKVVFRGSLEDAGKFVDEQHSFGTVEAAS
jgi:hypothetical protein